MFMRNSQAFDINAFHLIDDVQYPVGWFHDAGNRAALDVIEVDDPPDVVALHLQHQETRRLEIIKAQIAVLDLRRIRPLAEGDAEYLADLNAQIVALRAQL